MQHTVSCWLLCRPGVGLLGKLKMINRWEVKLCVLSPILSEEEQVVYWPLLALMSSVFHLSSGKLCLLLPITSECYCAHVDVAELFIYCVSSYSLVMQPLRMRRAYDGHAYDSDNWAMPAWNYNFVLCSVQDLWDQGREPHWELRGTLRAYETPFGSPGGDSVNGWGTAEGWKYFIAASAWSGGKGCDRWMGNSWLCNVSVAGLWTVKRSMCKSLNRLLFFICGVIFLDSCDLCKARYWRSMGKLKAPSSKSSISGGKKLSQCRTTQWLVAWWQGILNISSSCLELFWSCKAGRGVQEWNQALFWSTLTPCEMGNQRKCHLCITEHIVFARINAVMFAVLLGSAGWPGLFLGAAVDSQQRKGCCILMTCGNVFSRQFSDKIMCLLCIHMK